MCTCVGTLVLLVCIWPKRETRELDAPTTIPAKKEGEGERERESQEGWLHVL